MVRWALRLSAHILAEEPGQLCGQLLGRLLGTPTAALASLLERAQRFPARPWLRPFSASLTATGGQLLSTLAGHADWIRAVVVTADGRTAVSASIGSTLKVCDLASGIFLTCFRGDAPFTSCAFASDRDLLIAGDGSGHLHFFCLCGR
jgi:WD40 repeat protein